MTSHPNTARYTLLMGLCMILLAPAALATKVYKWVDENGVPHFSEHPPKNVQATQINPRTGHSDPVFYGSSSSASSEASDPNLVTQQEYDQERCDVARKNMETLRNFGRVKFKGEDGEFQFLTEEEREIRIQRNQEAIDEAC